MLALKPPYKKVVDIKNVWTFNNEKTAVLPTCHISRMLSTLNMQIGNLCNFRSVKIVFTRYVVENIPKNH